MAKRADRPESAKKQEAGKKRSSRKKTAPVTIPPLDELPTVFVAVSVITWGELILAVYNPKWGSFTLPMTKHRRLVDRKARVMRDEHWPTTAARAAAEWTGALFSSATASSAPGLSLVSLKHLLTTVRVIQGDRDGKVKAYNFRVYGLDFVTEPQLVPGSVTTWLTADRFLDENLCPISDTARLITGWLREVAQRQGKTFPDPTIDWTP